VAPRNPDIPEAFDVYTLAILRRPVDAPTFTDSELSDLQAAHLAYRADLARRGVLVVNGPLLEQTDAMLRGISIFACDLAEAARLNDADPMVVAGRLGYEVMEWWVAAGSLSFPNFGSEVGNRRSMDNG
jgi:uncharacterized protein YciI